MIHNIKLIEKGEVIGIHDVFDRHGQQLADFEITLGVDILKFDDAYVDYNGSLVVSDKEVEDAVMDYMNYKYPEVYDYMLDM